MKTPESISINDLAQRFGRAPILQDSSREILWSELPEALSRWRTALESLQLRSGDTCALYLQPDIDSILLILALWTQGIIVVPLNTRLPVDQLNVLLQNIRCSILISQEQINIGSIRQVRFSGLLEIFHKTESKTEQLSFLLQHHATILFTSGSSGQSKACLHTLANHYFSALGSNENIQLKPGDRWLLSLPLFHVAGIGILFRCLVSGATICLPEPNLAKSIKSLRPTHLSLVATQLFRLLQQPEFLSQTNIFKAILLGGSAIPASLIKKAHQLGLPIFMSYGSTEMSSQITTTQPNDSLERLLSSGKVLPYRQLRVTKEGDIQVRGATLFTGYVDGETILPARDQNGWFDTGDRGELEAGYLQVKGRKDTMFISGGENVFPEEIEREILHLESVKRVVVVAVADAVWGERPAAFIETETFEQTRQEIRDLLPSRLPKYKWPDYVFPWPDIEEKGLKISRQTFQQLANEMLQDSTDSHRFP